MEGIGEQGEEGQEEDMELPNEEEGATKIAIGSKRKNKGVNRSKQAK